MASRRQRIEELRKRTEERKKLKGKSNAPVHLAHKGASRSLNNRYSIPCINEGNILEYCYKCNGELKHVRECDLHGTCTRGIVSNKVKSCIDCKDYQAES